MRRVLVAHSAFDGEQRPCGAPLTLAHAHALLTLHEASAPVSITALSSSVHIDRTNVSRLCARMERLGQVERRPNPRDGRSRLIRLTAQGRELAARVDAASARHFAEVVEALGDEAPAVLRALALLADALEGVHARPTRRAS